MARALFDPVKGYYSRQIRTVGARGDFSTTATLSPVLGQAIAGWLKKESALQPQVRQVIEIGAGSGVLMAGVKKSLGWWQRRRFHWHIVETSPVLQKQQQALLGRRVTWHQDLKDALTACGEQAFIYHNEVLDAFPVTLLQSHEDSWQEVHLDDQGREVLLPLTWDAPQRSLFSVFGVWPTRAKAQRVELHESVRQWLQHWAPAWKRGAMLTVDYGDLFPALYHRRPAGTLRAYLHQHRLEGVAVYQNPGRQDITADVNFSDFRLWAQKLGWQESSYGTQADFIHQHLKDLNHDTRTTFILDNDGAGSAFKHVVHRAGSWSQ